MVRRIALEGIGGFPRGSLAEDVATSTLLLGQGWKTAYVHEPLQFGTVPDSYGSHLKQRTRWVSSPGRFSKGLLTDEPLGNWNRRHILQTSILSMGRQD